MKPNAMKTLHNIIARPGSWLCKYPSCKGTITLEMQRQTITWITIVYHLHICLTTVTCSSCPSCSEQCLCVHIIMHTSEIGIVHCFSSNESFAAWAELAVQARDFHSFETIWLIWYRKRRENILYKIHISCFYTLKDWTTHIQTAYTI